MLCCVCLILHNVTVCLTLHSVTQNHTKGEAARYLPKSQQAECMHTIPSTNQ